MKEIVTAISNVTGIMAQITSASVEQSDGIAQVNQAVRQMDDVTQQNAALVEQAAASAESLEEQTENLSENVAKFKVDVMYQPSATRPAAGGQRSVTPVKIETYQSKPKTNIKSKPTFQASTNTDEWEAF